jgi:hypothetical protein
VVLTLIDPVKQKLASKWFKPIVTVGQQSLATFLASTALTVTCSVALDYFGRNWWDQTLVNLSGFACIILVAYIAKAFKSQPWRSPKTQAAKA